jgi:hypothetical protein
MGAAALPRRPRLLPRRGGAPPARGAGGALALVAAVVLAFTPLAATNATGFTEMWIAPLAGDNGVRVGVGSAERNDSSYRLVVNFGGSREVTRRLQLEPGQRQVLALGESAAASSLVPVAVTATLFKEDSADPNQPFRQVTTWLGPTGAAG